MATTQKTKKTKDPLISVIISSYNSARYIDQCVESLLAQTYPNFEVVIVDCSIDDTFELIRRYSDTRIKAFKVNERISPAQARNFAFSQSSGSLIALMDSDDYCAPNRLEAQLNHLLNTGADVCSSYFFEVDTRSGRTRKSKQARQDPDIRALMAIYNPVCNPSVMVKREVLRDPPYRIDYIYSEDSEMWCELALRARFTCCPKYLLYYRVHGSQMSQQFNSQALEWFDRARNGYLKALLGQHWTPLRETLSERLTRSAPMLIRLNQRIPGISWQANCQLYSRIQTKGGSLTRPLRKLERYALAMVLTLIGRIAKYRQQQTPSHINF